jgi:hypothetical protein
MYAAYFNTTQNLSQKVSIWGLTSLGKGSKIINKKIKLMIAREEIA